MDSGETFGKTVKREIKEELGIELNMVKLVTVFPGDEFFQEFPNGNKVFNVITLYTTEEIFESIIVDNKETCQAIFLIKKFT